MGSQVAPGWTPPPGHGHTILPVLLIEICLIFFDQRHTLGHAYELAGHYTEWSHGAAVAAGMCAAARLGVRLGVTPAELPERLEEALSALGLPTAIPCTAADYAVGLDKKGAGEDISVILLERMGRAVPHRMPKAQLLEELR
jgi:3-dehydroquinate synthase